MSVTKRITTKIHKYKKFGLCKNVKVVETATLIGYNFIDKYGCGCKNPNYIHRHFTTYFNDKKENRIRIDFGYFECKNCKKVFANYH